MIREKVGRRRYILFSVQGQASRTDIIHAINNRYRALYGDDQVPWLTVFEDDRGIVRCPHTKKEDVIQVLRGVATEAFSLTPLTTSGTIKKLKKKIYPQ
ncbi:MAG: Rpp14/Pop5 family protein [Candidatus Thermoplasmatota archaeon]|nr:Rpp14/Pop5 family protein [Candidatus Thermoplasmatota archaeon]MDD5777985.1 Rpp14/Pop5 family protein [Candidatus Thermoplasmatota archaeon]